MSSPLVSPSYLEAIYLQYILSQSGGEFLSLLKYEICLASTASYEGLHHQTKEFV